MNITGVVLFNLMLFLKDERVIKKDQVAGENVLIGTSLLQDNGKMYNYQTICLYKKH